MSNRIKTPEEQLQADLNTEAYIRAGNLPKFGSWENTDIKALLRLIDGMRRYICGSECPNNAKLTAKNVDLPEYNIRQKVDNLYATWDMATVKPLLDVIDKLRSISAYVRNLKI